MIGSNGPRMLAIGASRTSTPGTRGTRDYGNGAEGFAALNERVTVAVRDAGREPGESRRSACAFVALDRGGGERPLTATAPPIEGSPAQIAARMGESPGCGRRRK